MRTATAAPAPEPGRPNGASAADVIAAAAGSDPQPPPPGGLPMLGGLDFGALLPRRTSTDVLAGLVPLRLAGREYVLHALAIRPNREWKAALEQNLVGLLGVLESSGDDLGSILAAFSTQTEPMLAALYAYDTAQGSRPGVLPPREELEEEATDMDVLLATLTVWQVANPFAALALGFVESAAPAEAVAESIQTPPTPARTSGRRPSTGGNRARSKRK